jgi:hypothetical protein
MVKMASSRTQKCTPCGDRGNEEPHLTGSSNLTDVPCRKRQNPLHTGLRHLATPGASVMYWLAGVMSSHSSARDRVFFVMRMALPEAAQKAANNPASAMLQA